MCRKLPILSFSGQKRVNSEVIKGDPPEIGLARGEQRDSFSADEAPSAGPPSPSSARELGSLSLMLR